MINKLLINFCDLKRLDVVFNPYFKCYWRRV